MAWCRTSPTTPMSTPRATFRDPISGIRSGLPTRPGDSRGRDEAVDRVAASSLKLVDRDGFREYFDPFEGTGYGTSSFGWSAAVTIDLIERLGPRPAELLKI